MDEKADVFGRKIGRKAMPVDEDGTVGSQPSSPLRKKRWRHYQALFVIEVLLIAVLALSLQLEWYSWDYTGESVWYGGETEWSMDLWDLEIQHRDQYGEEYDEKIDWDREMRDIRAPSRMYLNARSLVAFSVMLSFGCLLIVRYVGRDRRRRDDMRTYAVIIAVLLCMTAIYAPLSLYEYSDDNWRFDNMERNFPDGVEGPWTGFHGHQRTSINNTSTVSSWGPSIGWYMSLVAGLLSIFNLALVYDLMTAESEETVWGKLIGPFQRVRRRKV